MAHASATGRRPVCKGCEQTGKDADKRRDHWRAKARDIIRRHAPKLCAKAKITREELIHTYGWTIERIAHRLKHSYENTCDYCGLPYLSMGHGYADVTLDVYDRDALPELNTNVRICCATCNREKGDKRPDVWSRDLLYWREYRQWLEKKPREPEQLHLF